VSNRKVRHASVQVAHPNLKIDAVIVASGGPSGPSLRTTIWADSTACYGRQESILDLADARLSNYASEFEFTPVAT
jgi:hypothetical protein